MGGRIRTYTEAETLVIWATTQVDYQTCYDEGGDQGHCESPRNQWSVLGA